MGEQSLPKSVKTIVVGSGLVGCSVAYHLAAWGHTDILVLDKGDLHQNDGSTSLSSGVVSIVSESRCLTDLAAYSRKLYAELPPFQPDEPCFRAEGGIDLAYDDSQYQSSLRRAELAAAHGLEANTLTPSECLKMAPLLSGEGLVGGVHFPLDGTISASATSSALAREAAKRGARFFSQVEVKSLIHESGQVRGVHIEQGEIRASTVILCNSFWAERLTQQVGLNFPVLPFQHQFAFTETLKELADTELPLLRLQSPNLYFCQRGQSLGIGSYQHKTLPVSPAQMGDTARRKFLSKHFKDSWSSAQDLIPKIKGKKLSESINSLMALTPDGAPLVGPSAVPGLWVAAGVSVTHAGGVGRALTEWLLMEAPNTDCSEIDINRFAPFQSSQQYLEERCSSAYLSTQLPRHPAQPALAPRNVRLTPVHSKMVELGAELVEKAGWEIPLWYESNRKLLNKYKELIPERPEWSSEHWSPIQGAEHLAVREGAGLFNLGSLSVLEFVGPNARAFLDRICTNRIDPNPGSVVYTLMLDSNGGVRTSATVANWGDHFWMVNRADLLPREKAWIRWNLPQDGSVRFIDRSSGFTTLGLWGPNSREILSQVCVNQLDNDNFPYYACRDLLVAGIPVKALRVSFAGELGWELYAGPEFALGLWERIWEAGQSKGLVAAGAGCLDSLRIEKGYPVWGRDMNTEHTPSECGLESLVGDKKFLGSEVLTMRSNPTQLYGLTLEEGGPLGGEPVFRDEDLLGFVTSANNAYSMGGGGLCIARLKAGIDFGEELEIGYQGERLRCQVSQLPAFDPKGTRLTS